MEIQEESYEYFIEHQPIIGKEPFGLIEKDMEGAISSVRKAIGQWITTENSPDVQGSKKLAKKTRQFYEKQLVFLTEASPNEVLGILKTIYDRVVQLQKSGMLRNETGEAINREFPEAYEGFYEMLRGQYASWANNLEGAMQYDIVHRNLEERKKQNALGRFVSRIIRK